MLHQKFLYSDTEYTQTFSLFKIYISIMLIFIILNLRESYERCFSLIKLKLKLRGEGGKFLNSVRQGKKPILHYFQFILNKGVGSVHDRHLKEIP